jgi:GDP-L-fucose synthase
MDIDSKIFVAGHRGLSGSAIVDLLKQKGYTNIVTKSRIELDLRNQNQVHDFFTQEKIEYVFDCAAKVGGIHANNTYPADFIYDNLMIQTNLIHSAYKCNVKKFLFLGSVCIYPKFAPLPIVEDCLLTGFLEPTNEAYAVAKISGIKMCQAYRKQYGFNAISLMPTNLYGPGDNYHPENSHVMAAMIRRFHEAKVNNLGEVYCWGDGSSKREFLYSYDLADACILAMDKYDDIEIMNISTGREYSIKEISELVCEIVGYKGKIMWDSTKPNGTIKRPLYIQKIKDLGWSSKTELRCGIEKAYSSFLKNYTEIK